MENKILKRTLTQKQPTCCEGWWMHHFTTAVKAALHCPSPRGSACVQAAPAGKIQTTLRSRHGNIRPVHRFSCAWSEYLIIYDWRTHCLAPGLHFVENKMASLHYLPDSLLCGEKSAALSPATFDRLQIGVAVIPNKVLHEVLRHAEDQRAVLPLNRGQRSHMLRQVRKYNKSYNH